MDELYKNNLAGGMFCSKLIFHYHLSECKTLSKETP